jgi:hypothetical protein
VTVTDDILLRRLAALEYLTGRDEVPETTYCITYHKCISTSPELKLYHIKNIKDFMGSDQLTFSLRVPIHCWKLIP